MVVDIDRVTLLWYYDAVGVKIVIVKKKEPRAMAESERPDEKELHIQFRSSVNVLCQVEAILQNSVGAYYEYACFESLLCSTELAKRKRQNLTELHINMCFSLRKLVKAMSEAERHLSQIRMAQGFPESS